MSTPQPPGIPDQPPATPPPPAAAPPAAAPPGAAAPPTAAPPAAEPSEPGERLSTWQPLLYLRIGLLLAAIAYSIAFVVKNSREINVHFVFASAKVRLIWEILLLLGIGLVGGILLSQLYRHRRRAKLAKKPGKARHSRADLGGRDKAVGKSS